MDVILIIFWILLFAFGLLFCFKCFINLNINQAHQIHYTKPIQAKERNGLQNAWNWLRIKKKYSFCNFGPLGSIEIQKQQRFDFSYLVETSLEFNFAKELERCQKICFFVENNRKFLIILIICYSAIYFIYLNGVRRVYKECNFSIWFKNVCETFIRS